MHVISKKELRRFWGKHPDSKAALATWLKIMRGGKYTTLNELRKTFPKADKVGDKIVFEIGGNKYRLVVVIHFNRGKVFIRNVLTHKAYDEGRWKDGRSS